MPEIKAWLFGRTVFLVDNEPVQPRDRLSRVMLALLLLWPHHTTSRSLLVETLTGNADDKSGRSRLSVYLSRLRAAIPGLLQTTGDIVALSPELTVWTDVAEFQALVTQARQLDPKDPRCKDTYAKAMALYRQGEFLAGVDIEWCNIKREQLHQLYLEALKGLALSCQARKDYTTALECVSEWLRLSPLNDEAQYELMLLHWAKGHVLEALAAYERYATMYNQELKNQPSARLQDFYAELQEVERSQVQIGSDGEFHKYYCCKQLLLHAEKYERQGRRTEQSLALDEARALAEMLPNHDLLATVQVKRAIVLWRTGQFQAAREVAKEALGLFERLGDKTGQVESLVYLGYCDYYEGHFDAALRLFEQAHGLAQYLGTKFVLSRTLNALGMVHMALEKAEQALVFFEKDLEYKEEIGSSHDKANILSNLGAAYHTLGWAAEALDCYKRSLDLLIATGLQHITGSNLSNMGALYDDVGLYEESLPLYERAYDLFLAIKGVHAQVSTLLNLTATYVNLGRLEIAAETGVKALDLAREIKDQEGEAGALLDLGHIHLKSGKLDEATACLDQVLLLSEPADFHTLIAKAHAYLAECYLKKGDVGNADSHSAQAIKAAQETDAGPNEHIWWTRYLTCQAVNKPAEAKSALQEAYAVVQEKLKKIQDAKLRHSFLSNVAIVREIVKAAKSNDVKTCAS